MGTIQNYLVFPERKYIIKVTRPEATLAQHLVLGYSLEEAAQRREVSHNTTKTQLQSIFSKTGTHRQSELVSLLLRSVASISLKI